MIVALLPISVHLSRRSSLPTVVKLRLESWERVLSWGLLQLVSTRMKIVLRSIGTRRTKHFYFPRIRWVVVNKWGGKWIAAMFSHFPFMFPPSSFFPMTKVTCSRLLGHWNHCKDLQGSRCRSSAPRLWLSQRKCKVRSSTGTKRHKVYRPNGSKPWTIWW